MKFQDHKYYNSEIELSDNSKFKISIKDLYNESLNNFKDWECNVGVDSLCILPNKDVYNGQCKHDKLGNLQTGWELATGPVTCTFNKCGCLHDLLVTKQSPDYNHFQQTKGNNI